MIERAVELAAKMERIKTPAESSEVLGHLRDRVSSIAKEEAWQEAVERAAGRVDSLLVGEDEAGWCFGQGDYKPANIIFSEDGADIRGIIDWGAWTEVKLPGYEVAFFLTDIATKKGASLVEVLMRWRDALPTDPWAVTALRSYEEHTGRVLSRDRWAAIMAWQWLKRLAPLADGVESQRLNYKYLDSMANIYGA